MPKGQKISRRESLQQVAAQLKRLPRELRNAPKIPDGYGWLWSVYVSLKNAAAGPVSYSEIEAYCRLTGESLTPFEVDAIRAMDVAHMRGSQ